MIKRRVLPFCLHSFFFFAAIPWPVMADPVEDKQALLDFIANIGHSHSLNWNESTSVCRNWTGVLCNSDQSRVVALQLSGLGLQGQIQFNTISRLSSLQILSLRFNNLSGSLPFDLSKLENLTSLYLQFNKFSGPLPADFSVWKNLTVIDLSNNAFNGSIPSSISTLTHLTVLNLYNNFLSGEIPDLNLPNLQHLDLSNNNLTGSVPRSLQRFPSGSFSGNALTDETAIPPLPVQPANSQPSKKRKTLDMSVILGISIGGCVAVFALIAVLMIVCRSMKGSKMQLPRSHKQKGLSLKKGVSEGQYKKHTLKFFQDSNFAFDLEDLLTASADVLGKGTFGTSYKAALDDGTTVVVKRLKEVTIPKREFEQHMEMIGNIKHENVVPLRAYYYSKEEKLMVSDFQEQGSIFAMLHANRGRGRMPLDWETRLRAAAGAARGIAHVHTENGGKLIHGNIKASNVFLNSNGYGCISDIGLAPLTNPTLSPAIWAGGYRAPELTDMRKASHSSDVYSFGVFLLELLTGKSPMHAKGGEEIVDLVRWVNSVIREEWTAEVFDVELLQYPNIEEEMVEMLQVALSCVSRMPEQRPKMAELLPRIEQVRQLSNGNGGRLSAGAKLQLPTTLPPVSEIASSSNSF